MQPTTPRFQGLQLHIADYTQVGLVPKPGTQYNRFDVKDDVRLVATLTGNDYPFMTADEIVMNVPSDRLGESKTVHLKSDRIGELSNALSNGETDRVEAELADTVRDVIAKPDNYEEGFIPHKGTNHTHTSMVSGSKPWDLPMLKEWINPLVEKNLGQIEKGLKNFSVTFDRVRFDYRPKWHLFKQSYEGPVARGSGQIKSGQHYVG